MREKMQCNNCIQLLDTCFFSTLVPGPTGWVHITDKRSRQVLPPADCKSKHTDLVKHSSDHRHDDDSCLGTQLHFMFLVSPSHCLTGWNTEDVLPHWVKVKLEQRNKVKNVLRVPKKLPKQRPHHCASAWEITRSTFQDIKKKLLSIHIAAITMQTSIHAQ